MPANQKLSVAEASGLPPLFVWAGRPRSLWILAALTLLSGAAMLPAMIAMADHGASLIAFEDAGTVARSQEILAEWGAAGKTAAWWQLVLDLPFLVGYGLFAAGACAAVARRAARVGKPRAASARDGARLVRTGGGDRGFPAEHLAGADSGRPCRAAVVARRGHLRSRDHRPDGDRTDLRARRSDCDSRAAARRRQASGAGSVSEPLEILGRWLDEAAEARAPAPRAMTLVTATADGRPSARLVTLKRLEDEALVFTTALWTRKADELRRNPARRGRLLLAGAWPPGAGRGTGRDRGA